MSEEYGANGLRKVTEGDLLRDAAMGVPNANVEALEAALEARVSREGATIGTRKEGSAVGENSLAQGTGVGASGKDSTAQGTGSEAGGPASHAEGYMTKATPETNPGHSYVDDYGNHAEGRETAAIGHWGAHAEGLKTTASGDSGAHAEGWGTTASTQASHAEGYFTETQSAGSANVGTHAEGFQSRAGGTGAHAEGANTLARWEGAHAEGSKTFAQGTGAHAEGEGTAASGRASHAQGIGTVAASAAQAALGTYNVEHPEEDGVLVAVGNGTSDEARSDAATLGRDGDAWLAGGLRAAGAELEGDLAAGGALRFGGIFELSRGGSQDYWLTRYSGGDYGTPVRQVRISDAGRIYRRDYADGAWGGWAQTTYDATASQTAGAVLAAPAGAAGAASFRALVANDLPAIGFSGVARGAAAKASGFNYNVTSNTMSASSSSLANATWNHYTTVKVSDPGVYLVYCHVRFPSAPSGVHSMALSTSTDAPSSNGINYVTEPGTATRVSATFLIDVVAADTNLYLHVYQSSGSAADIPHVNVRGFKVGRT